MIQFMCLLLLCVTHFITGHGVLTLWHIRVSAAMHICLSLLLGTAVASVVPFILQLCYIPITRASVFGLLAAFALLPNIKPRLRLPAARLRVRIYEWPFILFIGFLVLMSVLRCYYLPPQARDMLSGPETIAEYAVKEHTMLNSVFTINLETTNNQFKSPFIPCLQIIYKMAGFPYGQMWLAIISVCLTVFLYHALKQTLHPVIAGTLLLLFTIAPILYGYSFIILYDYSNMVFLFLGIYFMIRYFHNRQLHELYFSALLTGIATYIRAETLVLALMLVPAILLMQYREQYTWRQMLKSNGIFILASLVAYFIPNNIYNKYYLPVHYETANLVNGNLFNLQPLFTRLKEISTRLIFSEWGIDLWGYFIFVFVALLLAEAIALRKFSRAARNWLYTVLVVYVGLAVIGFVLPLMDLQNSTKRGLMKILPVMLLYMANNGLLTRLSAWIKRQEEGRVSGV